VGGLAGYNEGQIVLCSVSGRVSGENSVGGLVGCNIGGIGHSYATASVDGQWAVGGLIGSNIGYPTLIHSRFVHDCHFDGSVQGDYWVGGLIGDNYKGLVTACTASGTASGSVSVGGLLGRSSGSGSVTHCSAIGSVVAAYDASFCMSFSEQRRCHNRTGYHAGGLIGMNDSAVHNCSAHVSVVGRSYIGGLIGHSYGNINNCYSSGPVTGNGVSEYIGAFIGKAVPSPYRISKCHAVGTITTDSNSPSIGAFVGNHQSLTVGADLNDCFFLDPNRGDGKDNGFGIALTTEQMGLRESFTAWDFYGIAEDGAVDDWYMSDEGYPVLTWQTDETGLVSLPDITGLSPEYGETIVQDRGLVIREILLDYDQDVPVGYTIDVVPKHHVLLGGEVDLLVSIGPYEWLLNSGDGSAENPYQISTASELAAMSYHPEIWSSCFQLTGDVNMGRFVFDTSLIAGKIPFQGDFDGRRHVISNLTILTYESVEHIGMFGYIGSSGTVRNLVLEDVNVQGVAAHFVAALIGRNRGEITNCHVSGTVHGSCNVHGLAGENVGKITHSTSSVKGVYHRCTERR